MVFPLGAGPLVHGWRWDLASGHEQLGNVSSQLALQEELAYGRAIDGPLLERLERLKQVCWP